MRFKRQARFIFTDTSRKRAALRRKQQRERDAMPLFADQIAAGQPCEDDVMQARAEAWGEQERRDRSRRARDWRSARATLAAMSRKERRVLRRAWNCAPYPADPSNLSGFLHSYRLGRFSLDDLPFPLTRTDPHGRRRVNFFDMKGSTMFMTILQARDIAAAPSNHTPEERLAAYHHLQKAAAKNKDRCRGNQDRVLSAALYLKLEDTQAQTHA
ncbi:hypothetical protein ROLI_048070 (plasmid) [Roseobacter fucihabitans]|uniref:Uncharacterized protein n=1 Tax=Roseobacter fucihabitans TaxID=1537242 RepID=A0ABZ2C1W2_9RHOB|nr:hypothetical protein [Roseobacter litoralis]MBC6967298.1 hypothetical protein [Roseobacter litoralis]